MITLGSAAMAALLVVPAPVAPPAESPAGAEAAGGSAVTRGPDGAYYVGDRAGRVLRIAPGHVPQVYATGLPGLVSLAWGTDHRLYARATTRKRLRSTVLIQVSRTGAHRVMEIDPVPARR